VLVLVVDSDSLPSQTAIQNLNLALEGTDYKRYTAVLERKYHSSVCISYQIDTFPTLLIYDDLGNVLHREDRVRYMGEDKFRSLLQAIDYYTENPL
jgi:hypothetical protein